jgi:hypothetical protein
MKLREWARANNVHPKTADRWWRHGTLPGPGARYRPARSWSSTQDPRAAVGSGCTPGSRRMASGADLDRARTGAG